MKIESFCCHNKIIFKKKKTIAMNQNFTTKPDHLILKHGIWINKVWYTKEGITSFIQLQDKIG